MFALNNTTLFITLCFWSALGAEPTEGFEEHGMNPGFEFVDTHGKMYVFKLQAVIHKNWTFCLGEVLI